MTRQADRQAAARARWVRRIALGASPSATAPTVLIDGPSGAGKSSLARALANELSGSALVALDDIYPGWYGLRSAVNVLSSDILRPRSRSSTARWQRWDWHRSTHAEWHAIPASQPLIVEGCGALSATGDLDAVRIWVSADDAIRRVRALSRDAGVFTEYWDVWEAQWRAVVAERHPETTATVRFRQGMARPLERYAQPSRCSSSSSMP